MSNKIYDNKLYNEYQKNRYLQTVPVKSKTARLRVLYRAAEIEEQYGIDLCQFDISKIESLLNYLEPSTINSSRSNFSFVESYIHWCIEQDLRGNNINPMSHLKNTNYFKKFVNDTKQRLFSKDEIDKMVNGCINAQDSVILHLLFEGASGNGYAELLNLTKHDIKQNRYIELTEDDGSKRTIQVSEKCIELIEKAMEQKEYHKKNGIVSPTAKNPPHVSLVESGYVLKNSYTRNNGIGKGDNHLILRRIRAIKEYNNDWVKNLTPLMIRNSGMLYLAYQIYKRNDHFGNREHYEEICDKFGVRQVENNGHLTYVYSKYKEDFLNEDTIKRVYGE